MIVPAIEALRVSSSEQLAAVLVSGDGTQRRVPVVWTSDAPDVAGVVADGLVTSRRLGAAVITATAQGLSTQQPLQVVPNYEGRWTGTRRVTGCTRISGAGPDLCRFVVVNGGAVLPLALTLKHDYSGVLGTLELLDAATHRPLEVGEVDGAFAEGGALTLSGRTQSTLPDHAE